MSTSADSRRGGAGWGGIGRVWEQRIIALLRQHGFDGGAGGAVSNSRVRKRKRADGLDEAVAERELALAGLSEGASSGSVGAAPRGMEGRARCLANTGQVFRALFRLWASPSGDRKWGHGMPTVEAWFLEQWRARCWRMEPVGSPRWKAGYLAKARAKGLEVPGWFTRTLDGLAPYVRFWQAWAAAMGEPAPWAPELRSLLPGVAGKTAQAAAAFVCRNVASGGMRQCRAVEALLAQWRLETDDEAARGRAARAAMGELAAGGFEVGTSALDVPVGFTPSADEIAQLALLARVKRLPEPARPPVRRCRAQCDRDPWASQRLSSFACLGEHSGAWRRVAAMVGWTPASVGQAEVLVVKGWLALAQDRALDGAAPVWEAAAVLMDRSALMVVFDLPSSGVGSGQKEDGVMEWAQAVAGLAGYEMDASHQRAVDWGFPVSSGRSYVRFLRDDVRRRLGSLPPVIAPASLAVVSAPAFNWAGAASPSEVVAVPAGHPVRLVQQGRAAARRYLFQQAAWVTGVVPVRVLAGGNVFGLWQDGRPGVGVWRARRLSAGELRLLWLLPAMVAAQVLSICRFCRPCCGFRPAECASPEEALARIGLPMERVRAFRQGMDVQWADHTRRVANGEAVTSREQKPAEVSRHSPRWSDERGLVPDAVPPEAGAGRVVYFLGDFWRSGDPKDIVPIQRAWRPVSALDNGFISRVFGPAFADQELLGYFEDGFVQGPIEDARANFSFLPRNQASAEKWWWWLDQALDDDVQHGARIAFAKHLSPPVWPFKAVALGVVDKDEDAKRGTDNMSHKGKVLPGFVRAPNDFDLIQHAPWLPTFNVHVLGQQALIMAMSGVAPVMAWIDLARYYKQFWVQPTFMAMHASTWPSRAGYVCLLPLTMLFGGKICSFHANRASMAVTDLVHCAIRLFRPQHPQVRRWFLLMRWAEQQRDAGEPEWQDFRAWRFPAVMGSYIDDFGMLALPGFELHFFSLLFALLFLCGLEPQFKKVFSEGQWQPRHKGLGVDISLEQVGEFSLNVPADKRLKGLDQLALFLTSKGPVDSDAWQRLHGLLNWFAMVLVVKARLSAVVMAVGIAAREGACALFQLVRLELEWWQQCLARWDGHVLVLQLRWLRAPGPRDACVPQTDASRSFTAGGAGGVFRGWYWAFKWSAEERELLNIMILEGFAAVLWLDWICQEHPEEVQGRRFRPWCDNLPFCNAVRKGSSHCPVVSWLLRRLHWLQAWFHFDVDYLVWVPSEDNVAADAASRGDWRRFFEAVTGPDAHTDGLSLVQVSDQMQTKRRSWSWELCRIARLSSDTPAAPSNACGRQ